MSSSRRAHPPASVPAAVITAAALPASDDVISPHLRADLPHHIVECPLLPGSGRTMRSYRVRHVDTGAVVVVRETQRREETWDALRARGAPCDPTQFPDADQAASVLLAAGGPVDIVTHALTIAP